MKAEIAKNIVKKIQKEEREKINRTLEEMFNIIRGLAMQGFTEAHFVVRSSNVIVLLKNEGYKVTEDEDEGFIVVSWGDWGEEDLDPKVCSDIYTF